MEQQNRITCPDCGRSGPLKPEMAGKKLKCKCGSVIHVPIALAAAAVAEEEPLKLEPVAPARKPAPPPQETDEYDVREPMPEPTRPVQRPADVIAYRSAPAEPENAGQKPAAPTFPSFMKPRTYQAEAGAEQSQVIKLVVILAIVVMVIGGAVLAIRYLGNTHTAPVAGSGKGEDSDIVAKMQDEYYKEVHEWFQEDGSRILGPWSQAQALGQVDRWKEMGAKNVYAFGSRISMVAVIELPDDPAKRQQLFDWQAQWHRNHFEKVWTDVGQKYLMIRLGI